MAINYTPNLGLALPVTGTEDGLWGDITNDEITQLLEDAVSGYASINVTAGNVTLTETDGVTDQARMAILIVSGTPGVTRDIIAPARSKIYAVINLSNASVVIKKSAGTGVTIGTGKNALVAYDNTTADYVALASSALPGGTLPVSSGGTGLTSGTSGGILYFNGTTTMASSAQLDLNEIVVGGGAGGAPSSITTGSGVLTALGVNTGTAGAFVIYDGDLGTPSAGDISNCTGTANININGTVGATTPSSGVFTYALAQELVAVDYPTAATTDAIRIRGNGLNVGSGYSLYLYPASLSAIRTQYLPDADTTLVGTDVTQTLSNKNIQARVVTLISSPSITINANTTDIAIQDNTQPAGLLTINAPTGTPFDGQRLILRLRSTNIQTFSWNGIFQGSTDLPLPTTSSGSSKFDYMGFVYNSANGYWQFVARTFGF